MKRIAALLLAALVSVGMCGCGLWMDGSYVSVEPHPEQYVHLIATELEASSYAQIEEALLQLVAEGVDKGIIFLVDMKADVAKSYMEAAVRHIREENPVGVYAVDDIAFDVGMNSGREAIAVTISYTRSRTDVLKIQYVADMKQAQTVIGQTLDQCESSVVFHVDRYEETDFGEIVRRHADSNPHHVMETPNVLSAIYPETGESRLVELVFTYQNDHETLIQMQEMIYPVFFSAELYVQGSKTVSKKCALLHAFLMERHDYVFESSPTPAYSLLQDGVGDSNAFSCVYAQMCRQAGMVCGVIHGTRNGEPWTWNVIRDGDTYYYVDLLRAEQSGRFRLYRESELFGYDWDKDSVYFPTLEES